MQVETFEIPEVAELTAEPSAECAALAKSLGLAGQTAIFAKPDAPAMPYRKVTAEEAFVYGEMCPKTVAATDYADGPIPLRVLQVLAHAQTFTEFKHFEVWCPNTAAEPDPVLVARTDDHYWRRDAAASFLLARWGDALETFEVLMERAKVKAAARLRAAWKSIAAKALSRAEGVSVDPSKGAVVEPWLHENS